MKKNVNGFTIDVNEEGFMTEFSQWNKEIAEELARECEVCLGDRHWEIIYYIQGEVKKQVPLSIRKIGKSGIIDIKEFYTLFPKAPLKTATKISGVPKPTSCL